MEKMMVRPDAKGRINLGELAAGVSSYRVNVSKNGHLMLIPYAEIPFSEKWIFGFNYRYGANANYEPKKLEC